jgi:hypothetical protein
MAFGKKKRTVGHKRKKKRPKVEEDDNPLGEADDYEDLDDEESAFEFNNDTNTIDDLDYLEFIKERSELLLKQDCFRKAVAFLFVTAYDTIDNTEGAWEGKNGIRGQIRDRLSLHNGTRLDHILNDVLACKKAGISYDGERHVGDAKVIGRTPIISVHSVEAQIIADALESGTSIPTACWLVNKHRKETGEESLCIAPVRNLIKRMDASVEKIKKRAQGSLIPTSVQAKAKLGWNKQLLVRFGKLKFDSNDNLLDCYNLGVRDMTKLDVNGTAWWDECHKKCTIGELGVQAEHHIKFRRDENGKLDLENGRYDDSEVHHVNVKYEQEVRQCFGCATTTITTEKGEEKQKGKRARSFDYSGKTIISIKAEKQNIRNEIERVRNLPIGRKWVYDPREKGSIFEEEQTCAIPNVGAALKKRLESFGMTTVKSIKKLTDDKILEISNSTTNRIGVKRLKTFRTLAAAAIPGLPPEIVDYRKLKNPYLAKYGQAVSRCEPEWKHQIRKCSQMSQYVCITELVQHIVTESANFFVGTEFEDTWSFYHDALSLMTGNDTVEWMREHDYLKRWILPVNELHQDDPTLSKYYHRPVGNSPENMPWDSSLNQDVHAAVQRHVLLTLSLGVDDKRKFDMSTPKRGSSAYHRILEVVPSSERIIHDVNKVFESMEIVRLALGVHCPGVGSRNYGVRHIKVEKKRSGGGGHRKKALDDYDDMVVHSDAAYSVKVKTEDSLSRVEGKNPAKVGKWMKEQSPKDEKCMKEESPKMDVVNELIVSCCTEIDMIEKVVAPK